MQANQDTCFSFTDGSEGPYSSDANDNGNWSSGRAEVGILIGSSHGVTAPELISWLKPQAVTAAIMRVLPTATAEAIWAARYWQTLRCDDLPSGADLMVADFGYNAGDGTAARELQVLLGFTGTDVDGWIGNDTVAALSRIPAAASALIDKLSATSAKALQGAVGASADGSVGPATKAAVAAHPAGDALVFCAALADAQAARYRSLDQFSLYGKGWLNRTWERLTLAMKLAVQTAAVTA